MPRNSVEIADKYKDKLQREVIDYFDNYVKQSRPEDLLNLDTSKLLDSLYVRLSNLEKEIENAKFLDTIDVTFKESGDNIPELIPSASFLSGYRFNMLYETTADAYRRYGVQSLGDFAKSTTRAVERALQRAINNGYNNSQLWSTFEGSFGLNEQQEQAMYNYSGYLASGSRRALELESRDKSKDNLVSNSLVAGVALSAVAMKSLISQYAKNMKLYRFGLFAEDQLQTVASMGEFQGFVQAGVKNSLKLQTLYKDWNTRADESVRSGHTPMNGQSVQFFDVFRTPLGAMRYPRDEQGSASNRIGCRCWLTYHIENES